MSESDPVCLRMVIGSGSEILINILEKRRWTNSKQWM